MSTVVGFSGYSGRRWFTKPLYLVVGAVVLVVVAGGVGLYISFRDTVQEKYDDTSLYESIANSDTNIDFGASFDAAQKIDYYIGEAWILTSASKTNEALAMLHEAEKLADDGPYPQLYNELGNIYAERGENKKAASYYKKAIESLEASTLTDKSEYRRQFEDNLERVE